MAERPLGVSILAVLSILFGALAVIGGIILASFGSIFMEPLLIGMNMSDGMPAGFMGFFSFFFYAMAIVLIISGLISVIIGYGLWNGKEWARILAIIFSVLGIIWGIFTLPAGIIGIIINGIILWYLTRPHVVSFFKGVEPTGQ